MRRFFRFMSTMDTQRKSNLTAIAIAVAAIGILRLEAAPIPAGSEVAPRVVKKPHLAKLEFKAASPIAVTAASTAPAIAAQPAMSTTEAPMADAAEAQAPLAPLTEEELSTQTLKHKMALLDAGIRFLNETPDYTAQFTKQELVNEELTDEQSIHMKVRHAPFSVYLKWLTGERGREVLYVDGCNDGEMLVRSGGWKGRLGTLSIDPHGSLAMREARHPVTKAGILELALMMQDFHKRDLEQHNYVRCEQLADQEFDGRNCSCFLIEYKDAAGSPTYRKSISLIDKEWSIPLYIKNYGWPLPDQENKVADALDDATLIEFYSFAEVRFRQQLANNDFDRNNEEYRLQ